MRCGVQAQGLAPARFYDIDFREVTQRKAASLAAVPDLRDRLGAGAAVSAEAGAPAPPEAQWRGGLRSWGLEMHAPVQQHSSRPEPWRSTSGGHPNSFLNPNPEPLHPEP